MPKTYSVEGYADPKDGRDGIEECTQQLTSLAFKHGPRIKELRFVYEKKDRRIKVTGTVTSLDR